MAYMLAKIKKQTRLKDESLLTLPCNLKVLICNERQDTFIVEYCCEQELLVKYLMENGMEDNSTASSSKLVDGLRQWTRNFASHIFAAPYLPIILTVFFITTVVTHLAITLMSQPLSYWHDPKNAVGFGIFGEKLSFGAGGLIVVTIVYVIVATLFLIFVNFRWSLIGWLIAEFVHFYLILDMLSSCYVSRWSVLLGRVCQITDNGVAWALFAVAAGCLLIFNFQPAEFSFASRKIEKGVSYASFIVPAVWAAVLITGVVISAQKPAYGWIPVEAKGGPRPTREAESAYDTRRNRLVVYGGAAGYLGNDQWDYITDTWEWDGIQWLSTLSQDRPQGRADHAMAFDEKRGVTVIFGGISNGVHLSDTWEWDGKSWRRINSPTSPPARAGHEMVYDPIREKVVIYGGYGEGAFRNDGWEWNGTDWTRIELGNDSPVASVFALAYDPNQNYIFGLLSGSPGGTWQWEGNMWTRFYPEIEPSNRGWTTLVYDPTRKLFFTFGGISYGAMLNDTWTYDGQKWKEYMIRGVKPAARADMIVWYDPIRRHVMLFGGYDNETIYDDTWEFIPPEE